MSGGYKSRETCEPADRESLMKMRPVRQETIKRGRWLCSTAVSRYFKRCSVSVECMVPLSRPGSFLPVLLIGALLLCHGVLGFTHEMSRGCDGPHPMQISAPTGEHAAGHTGGRGMEDPACGHMSAGYFAVVLALFGAALLGLFLSTQKRKPATLSPPRRTYSSAATAHLPRGPTLPLLQVYRL